MATRKTNAIICLLFIACLFGYSECHSQNKLEQEAVDQASSILNKLVVKCGDVWCLHIKSSAIHNPKFQHIYYQFQKAEIVVKAKELSNEDIAYGVEWEGSVKYKFSGNYRDTYGTEWRDWRDVSIGGPPTFVVSVKKYKEKPWNLKLILFNPSELPLALSCSELPK
ncbi:MAG: hypothetical protein ABSH41_12750 [Syntrophobacteraceae bacterium]|jgi:hypothetical protein